MTALNSCKAAWHSHQSGRPAALPLLGMEFLWEMRSSQAGLLNLLDVVGLLGVIRTIKEEDRS